MRPTSWLPLLVALVSLALATPAAAKRIYQYRDANGVLHFTDQKPPDGTPDVRETLVRAERQPIVDLLSEDGEGERRFSIVNRLAGPVEIVLSLEDAVNVASTPPSPVRAVLPPQSTTRVATVRAVDRHREARYALAYRAVPGDPGAAPDTGHVYRLPFADPSGIELHQAYGGEFSHGDPQSYYAIDLSVAEGTPVLAVREGVVMQVERDFHGAGLDREKFGGRANHVRILHADGTMAVYAHLALESVAVTVGQRVRAGQRIGLSGNTGFSTGPHLHFAIQVNTGAELESIPFRMDGLSLGEP